ncbi:DMT family transporter [Fodinicurvata sp. EGI_FJ10296]|uniref:DMT family transporter n=1 Tax=Fodinicurvata sp. EGI_FJ10296 TaxID=3231908 RepID=UPI0034531964
MTMPVASPIAAVLLMVAASACIAATTLIAKTLGDAGVQAGVAAEALHPVQVSAGRFVFAFLALVPLLVVYRPGLRGAAWPIHIGRSVAGWSGVSCMFAAAAMMPLAEATAISFLSPVVTVLLAIPLLRERVGIWRIGAVITAMIGALVLIQPGTAAFQVAALLALAAAGFLGLEAIFVKKLTGGEPPLRILAINNAIGSGLAIAAASFFWVAPSPTQWLLLGAIGVIMVVAQALFIQAMRRGDASFVIPFFYATLIFAALYDMGVFGVIPSRTGMAGAALIVAGALVLAWRERRPG